MKISELKPGTKDVVIEAEIEEIGPVREFNKFGNPGKVANATIIDDSGKIQLTLWNDQIDQVKVGSKIKIVNGFVNEWQGQPQITSGKFGTLEVIEE